MAKKKPTDREIEQRYESGVFRLTQERNDFVLPQIIDFIDKNRWINLRPEYQRRLVWDNKKRSLFIESLLMNIPIPPVFLFEWEYSKYEVMDGQQRLNTIREFYNNQFRLTGLQEWPELNRRTYSECPPTIQKGLDRRRIAAVVLLAENLKFDSSQFDVRRLVFERLNTGGQNLNAQELRNCLYSGAFNDLVTELAGDDLFDDMWGIPRYSENITGANHISQELMNNSDFKRMRDCENVLRFFAFRLRKLVKGSVKNILDKCMEHYNHVDEDELEDLRKLFRSRLALCYDVFGRQAFRTPGKKGRLSQPLYDAEMIAIDRLYKHGNELAKKRRSIVKKINDALADDDTYELIVARPNTATAIRKRQDLVTQLIQGVIGG